MVKSTALKGEDLDLWTEQAMKIWMERPDDHSSWFFVTTSEIPRWAGYSIGFKLVQDYLAKNTDRRPSNLFDEPAVSFIP